MNNFALFLAAHPPEIVAAIRLSLGSLFSQVLINALLGIWGTSPLHDEKGTYQARSYAEQKLKVYRLRTRTCVLVRIAVEW